jgi:hypothetical protein
MSDADYQATKADLQKELAAVLAEVDKLKAELTKGGAGAPAKAKAPARNPLSCPHCGAEFRQRLKFCGECGKPMEVSA